jgi:hypothetical protein
MKLYNVVEKINYVFFTSLKFHLKKIYFLYQKKNQCKLNLY